MSPANNFWRARIKRRKPDRARGLGSTKEDDIVVAGMCVCVCMECCDLCVRVMGVCVCVCVMLTTRREAAATDRRTDTITRERETTHGTRLPHKSCVGL